MEGYSCGLCPLSCPSPDTLEAHVKKEHDNVYTNVDESFDGDENNTEAEAISDDESTIKHQVIMFVLCLYLFTSFSRSSFVVFVDLMGVHKANSTLILLIFMHQRKIALVIFVAKFIQVLISEKDTKRIRIVKRQVLFSCCLLFVI